jgi:hypothetical protein
MTSRVPKLVLAAVLAASLPAAAAARDCAPAPDHASRAGAGWAPYRPGPVPAQRWREASWRETELRRVRAELAALDRERAEYHARHAWQPRKLHRYDREYAERRAELERRSLELQQVAWR